MKFPARSRFIAVSLASVVAVTFAHVQSIDDCRGVTDNTARLACYDEVIGPPLAQENAEPAIYPDHILG